MRETDVLLFLPGLLCDGRLWRDQVEALAGTRCVVADLTHDDSLGGMAERALRALPAEARLSVCGLSMGGYVAFEIMRRAPGRVARLHSVDLNHKYAFQGLDLPELRAVFASLPER
jgi:pimeloyl-ACP methyl ester carboxylesterase